MVGGASVLTGRGKGVGIGAWEERGGLEGVSVEGPGASFNGELVAIVKASALRERKKERRDPSGSTL